MALLYIYRSPIHEDNSMASDRKDLVKKLGRPSTATAASCSFFISPTIWSVLTSGVSAASGYVGNLNTVGLISSLGGAFSYFGAGVLSLKNEADHDVFREKIESDITQVVEKLILMADMVTVLNDYDEKNTYADGFYLYKKDTSLRAAIVINGAQTNFSLGTIRDDPFLNFISQLIDPEIVDEENIIINGNIGLVLCRLIHSRLSSLQGEIDQPNVYDTRPCYSYYLSGGNIASTPVILAQLVAFLMCAWEASQYYQNMNSEDEHQYDPSETYLFAAPLIKMMCAFTYGFLRKYEDTGEALLNEEYQSIAKKVLENIPLLHEKTQEKDMLLAQAQEIFREYLLKTEQLRDIEGQLKIELGKIERIGEKDAVSRDAHEKIEPLVEDFKRILTATRNVDSEEVSQFIKEAIDNITAFIKNYNQKELTLAFNSAQKSILEAAKGKLQAEKQDHRSVFNVTYG